MDFIEGLPVSNGANTILVMVDQLMKYTHFFASASPLYSSISVQGIH
jgi:hypothetical protein